MPKENQRQHERHPAQLPVWVSWEGENGIPRRAIARCLDLSKSGIRLELFTFLETGREVTVGLPRLGLTLKSVVRWCQPNGSKHALGLEFQERISEASQPAVGIGEIESARRFVPKKIV